jgi:hypothetical protein
MPYGEILPFSPPTSVHKTCQEPAVFHSVAWAVWAYRKISASSLASGEAVAHIEQKAYRIVQLRLAWRLYVDVTAGFAEYIAIGDGRVSILEKSAMNFEAQAFKCYVHIIESNCEV